MGRAHYLNLLALYIVLFALPGRSLAQLTKPLKSTRHVKTIQHLAKSPDGNWLATVAADGHIKIWDRKTETMTTEWDLPESEHFVLDFHPTAELLMTSYQNKIQVWNYRAASLEREIMVHHAPVTAMAFDREGDRMITADNDGEVLVRDFASGKVVGQLGMKEDVGIGVHALLLSEDEQYLFTGRADGFVDQWLFTREKIVYRYGKRGKKITQLALDTEQAHLAALTEAGGLKIWDAQSGAEIRALKEEGLGFRRIEFLRESPILVIGGYRGTLDDRLRIQESPADGWLAAWDVSEAEYQWQSNVEAAVLDFRVDQAQLLVVGDHRDIGVWEVENGTFRNYFGHFPNAINTMQIHHASGLLLLGGDDSQLKVADPETGRLIAVLPPLASGGITAIGQDMEQQLLVTAHGAILQFWQTDETLSFFEPLNQLDLGKGTIEKVFFTQDDNHEIMIVRRHRNVAFDTDHFVAEKYANLDHGFTATRRRIQHQNAAEIEIWNYETGTRKSGLTEYNGYGYEVAYDREKELLICANRYHEVVHIDWAKSTLLGDFPMHKKAVTVGKFSPDRSAFVSGGYDKVAWLWNLKDMQVKELQGMGRPILDACFDPGNTLLAMASDQEIRIVDLTTNQKLVNLPLTKPLHSLSFSADGKWLFGNTGDQGILVWDTQYWNFQRNILPFDRQDYLILKFNGHFTGTPAAIDKLGFSKARALAIHEAPRPDGVMFGFMESAEEVPVDQNLAIDTPEGPEFTDSLSDEEMITAAELAEKPNMVDEAEDLFFETEPEVEEVETDLYDQLNEHLFSGRFSELEALATDLLYENAGDLDTRMLLAISFLYQGKFEKARMIWHRYRNSTLASGANFSDSMRSNLRLMQDMGITHRDVARFQNQVMVVKPVVAVDE